MQNRFPFLAPCFGWLHTLILFAGLCSCAVDPKSNILEGKLISSVVIRHSMQERATHEWDRHLRSYMKLRTGIPYSSELAEHDIRSLYESGYVDDARLLAEEDGQALRIIFEIKDDPGCGPNNFSIIGNAAYSDLKLGLVLKSVIKNPITETQVMAARDELEEFYHRHGYQQAHITIDYKHWGERSIPDFVLVIDEGLRTTPWYEALFQLSGNTMAP